MDIYIYISCIYTHVCIHSTHTRYIYARRLIKLSEQSVIMEGKEKIINTKIIQVRTV